MKSDVSAYGLCEVERAKDDIGQPTTPNKKGPRTLAATFIPACLDDAGLKPRDFRVFCHVSRCGEKNGCYQELDTIAEACRMHRQTVQASLKFLVAAGFIVKEKRPGTTCVYRVNKAATYTKKPASPYTKKPSAKVSLVKLPSGETGASASLQRHSSFSEIASKHQKPESMTEVIVYSLTRIGVATSKATKWVKQFDFHADVCDITARGILDAVVNVDESVIESLKFAFRFCHYNNGRGWPLTHHWRTAFDGFVATCEAGNFGQGAADVPLDWVPHIAGVDGWPEDDSEPIPY